MRAMILAAGRGNRMRPLTDKTPKPLLLAGGKPLLTWHIEKLREAGVTEIVINSAWLGEQLQAYFGDGAALGVSIQWSPEPSGGLETAGGIIQALPMLTAGVSSHQPFWLISGDIWTDYPFHALPRDLHNDLAHLVLVDNPSHHPAGDFSLDQQKVRATPRLTYSGVSVLSPRLFAGAEVSFSPLRPFFERAIAAGRVQGEHYRGKWTDVGTPERLEQLNEQLARS